MSIINNHTYSSGLCPWDLDNEVETLTQHIRESISAPDSNSLWRYFSMSLRATPSPQKEGEDGIDAKLDFINMQMKSIKKQLSTRTTRGPFLRFDGSPVPYDWGNVVRAVMQPASLVLPEGSYTHTLDGQYLHVTFYCPTDNAIVDAMRSIAAAVGMQFSFEVREKDAMTTSD